MNTLARWSIGAALAITALLVAVVAFGQSRAAGTTALSVGQSAVIALPGNPSTGYSWRLDTARSENATILGIEDLGYAKSEPAEGATPRVGAPASYRFRITGAAAGTARLVFEYVQPWVGEPARADERDVHVTAP